MFLQRLIEFGLHVFECSRSHFSFDLLVIKGSRGLDFQDPEHLFGEKVWEITQAMRVSP